MTVARILSALFIPLICIAFWALVTLANAAGRGWTTVAYRHRARHAPSGTRFSTFSNAVHLPGETGMGWNTGTIVSTEGLYLFRGIFHRAFQPSILVPWEKIVAHPGSGQYRRYMLLEVDRVLTVAITERAFTHVRPYLCPLRGG